MPSRVIHIRVDDWVLLGCHDIFSAGEMSTENLPMSSIVRDVVTALVRKMQQNEQIPFYSKDQIMDRLDELYGGDLEIEIPFDPIELFNLDDKDESDTAKIAREAAEIIAADEEPGIASDKIVDIAKRSKKPKKIKSIDLFKQIATPFATLKNQAPKDRFVEQAIELSDEVFTQAVCICYANLSRDLWGSEEAGAIIMDLVSRHNAK